MKEIVTFREKGAAMVAKLGQNCDFAEVDIDNAGSLEAALSGIVVSCLYFDLSR